MCCPGLLCCLLTPVLADWHVSAYTCPPALAYVQPESLGCFVKVAANWVYTL